jgi:hypothetical protein
MGQMWRMMKTLAWSKGRDHLTTDDMMICQHMAWNSPEHVEKAREIVTDYAGSFTQAAVGHRDAMEPILKKADEALVKLADEDEATHDAGFDEGWEALRDMKRLRDKIRNDIQNANEQGHDARELERVLEEVNRAHKHTKARLDKDDPAAEDDDEYELRPSRRGRGAARTPHPVPTYELQSQESEVNGDGLQGTACTPLRP